MPAAVPAPAGVVLGVGEAGPFEVAGQGPVALVGGAVDGGPAAAVPLEQALGDDAPEARPELVGADAARFGDREQLGGVHGAVGVGHPEDEDPGRHVGRDQPGRVAHDRQATRPPDSVFGG